ncbi:MAG: neutral/alkaline non-lysosomal ceramidase N-terminal domain-containing protein [Armatimonadota bacterium]
MRRGGMLILGALLCVAVWAQNLQAGAAANKITPNKQVYLAGYSPNRPNTGGVHDDIWVRALVLQIGQERIALAVCDLLGLLRDDVQKIRQRVRSVPPNRVIVACTHVHSAPDTIGLWGPQPTVSGRDNEYVNFVIDTVARTIDEAAGKLQPATIGFAKTRVEGIAYNYRVKEILDTEAAVLQVRRKADNQPIATLTNFACHPEVLNNDQLTADFPNWFYRTIEAQGGGVAIFANGALGGMVSPAADPNYQGEKGKDWARAERMGTLLANKTLEAVATMTFTDNVAFEHRSQTISVPLENEQFKQALAIGVIPKGESIQNDTLTTEAHLFRIGNAVFFTMPGEVLPNIGFLLKKRLSAYGDPVFLIGLGNDELGYILCEEDYWLDLYRYERSMSVGPEIGEKLVATARQLSEGLTPLAKGTGGESVAQVEAELQKYIGRFRPERAGALRATYRFLLEGAGEYYLRIAEGKASISKEGNPSEAQVTIRAPAQVFIDIITGKRNALDAYNTGELQVEGDIGLAQYLLYVFE